MRTRAAHLSSRALRAEGDGYGEGHEGGVARNVAPPDGVRRPGTETCAWRTSALQQSHDQHDGESDQEHSGDDSHRAPSELGNQQRAGRQLHIWHDGRHGTGHTEVGGLRTPLSRRRYLGHAGCKEQRAEKHAGGDDHRTKLCDFDDEPF